jgi:hypothetical protein
MLHDFTFATKSSYWQTAANHLSVGDQVSIDV